MVNPGDLNGTHSSTTSQSERREQVYQELFGKLTGVSREALPGTPPIDVMVFFRDGESEDVPFHVLVSSGMSDRAMPIPEEADGVARRAEIVLYVDEPRPEYLQLVHWMARFPHDSGTWLAAGHTMANGTPPQPIFGSGELDSFLLLNPIVTPDDTLPQLLSIEGDPVELLWIVPLTSAEVAYRQKFGYNQLLDLFDTNQHSFILDPDRRSYVRGTK